MTNTVDAPHQDNEGAPEAWIQIDSNFAEGIKDIKPNQEILILTWFHQSERNVLNVYPKNDLNQPIKGIFSTRSPSRPNPIVMIRVRVLEVAAGNKLRVDHLDALHGTPVVDLKPIGRTGGYCADGQSRADSALRRFKCTWPFRLLHDF